MSPLHPQPRNSRGAASIAVALVLSGCAALPAKVELRPLSKPDSSTGRESFAAAEAAWPSDRWWTAFGDPQLDQLITEGRAGATDLRAAQARFARADALVAQARSGLLPSISGSAQAGATQQSDNYLFPHGFAPRGWPDYGQASLDLNWELDFWGRNRAALAAARSDAEAASAEAAQARLVVSAGIASAYGDLAALYAERDAAQEAVKVRARTQALMRGRQDWGLENEGAIERANASLETARGELTALDESIALTRNRLAFLLGAEPDRGLSIARPELRLGGAFGLPAKLPAELIGRRPDVVAARLRAEAAASRVKEAHAAFYPNVNLVAAIGTQALGVDKLLKAGSDFGSAAPAVTLPIFQGGRLRGQYRAAEAEYQAAVAQYDGALAQALHEVADAAVSERVLAERLAHAQAAERSAASAWTVATHRYSGGLATYLEVLEAEDALISARRSLAALQTRSFSLDVALIRALGGGFQV